MEYVIKHECVVCWRCIDVCSQGAISECEIAITPRFSTPGVVIDTALCNECGMCKDICPVDAIMVV
jgi:formate hydrogenlyase subunit 6/NADH:ubiquinone oxidoreductase subunit I